MWKKENVVPAFCGIDQKGKALIADFGCGKIYLLDTKQKHEISIKEIFECVKFKQVCDAFLDGNNDFWTISGDKAATLTKYSQNRQN